ncbi:MAG TPA: PEP-CTERM sorting domain-containing protein [Rhodocyclaceae bacterium]|nr:PEP-CTERM sorting domain-containing protein [Rhodocyclaceae bacterium]
MQLNSRFLRAALVSGFAFYTQTAPATLISGSFTGRAFHVTGLHPPFLSVRGGDAVTGSFSLDTAPFELIDGGGVYWDLAYPPRSPQPLNIVFEVPARGESFALGGPSAYAVLAQEEDAQRLVLESGYGFGNTPRLRLTLFGGPEAFFSVPDLSTVHGGDVDLSRSFGTYSSLFLSFDVAFFSFSFDAVPVPEPATMPLAAAGVVVLIVARRRRASA